MSKLVKLSTIAFIIILCVVGLFGLWWRFSGYNTHAMMPWPFTWLSAREEIELNRRAQALYGRSDYTVQFEVKNPLFARMFPRAKMYAVWQNYHTQPQSGKFETMVSYKNLDYIMPEQFNQLMLKAGHELTPATRDDLAYALVVSALPPPLAVEPITCQEGMEIYVEMGVFPPDTYEIRCHATLQNYDIIVRFTDCSVQFQGGYLSISDEDGNHIIGYNFGPGRVMIEE